MSHSNPSLFKLAVMQPETLRLLIALTAGTLGGYSLGALLNRPSREQKEMMSNIKQKTSNVINAAAPVVEMMPTHAQDLLQSLASHGDIIA